MKKNRRLLMLLVFLFTVGIGQMVAQMNCNLDVVAELPIWSNGQSNVKVFAASFVANAQDYTNLEVSSDDINYGPSITYTCADVGLNNFYARGVVDGVIESCSGEITIEDNISPIAIVDFEVYTYGSITVDDVDDGSYDNCGIANRSLSQYSFPSPGTYTVTFDVTDVNGNSNSAITTVYVIQNALACNDNINGTLDSNGEMVIYPQDVVEGGPYSPDLQVFNQETGEGGDFLVLDCDDLGTFTIEVVDPNTGNTCWGSFTVEDKLKPVPYVNSNAVVSLNGGNSVTITPSVVDIGSFDNCSIETMTVEPSTFTEEGQYTVQFTITDQSGNSDFATTFVTVVNGGPVCNNYVNISLGTDQTIIPADVFIEGVADYDVMEVSLDDVNFGESVTFTCDDHGALKTVYVHIEEDGNEYNCTSIAFIEDKFLPSAIAVDFTINLDSETDSYTLLPSDIDGGSTDNCSNFTLEVSQSEFDVDDWGINSVDLTITDIAGNLVTATSTVTVLVDGEMPAFQCVDLSTVVIDAWGTSELWAVDFVVAGIDDFSQVLGSLDPQGPFTESFLVDCGLNDADPSTVYVQAFVGSEMFECSVPLTIVDNVPPVVVAKQNIVLELINGSATLTAEMVDNGSFDACTDIEISIDKMFFTSADIGVVQVWLTATDMNGYYNMTWTNVTVIGEDSDCSLNNVIFPEDINISDDNATVDNLSIENLQALYGYTFQEVHPYTVAECDGIAYSYEDLVLNFNFGYKVLRTWTGIDWYTTSIVTNVQVLKLYTSYNDVIVCDSNISVTTQNGPITIYPVDVLEGGPYDYDNMILSIADGNDNIVVDNIITSAYNGQSLIYTVTDISTGNSCFGTILVQGGSGADELIITASTLNVPVGTSVCVPLRVENFIGVQAGSGTILWNPNIISYTGLSNTNLPGVEGSLNETNTVNGELKFIWSNPDPANPLTLPNGEEIFEICFDAVGVIGSMSPVTLSTSGSLGFEWTDDDDNIFPQELVDGKVTIGGMPCTLDDEDVSYPLANIYLPEFNLDPEVLDPDYLIENYGYQMSEVLITWPDEDCLIVSYSFEDEVFDYGNGSFKIARTLTAIDWTAFDPVTMDGIWTFTQMIDAGIDQISLICDVLPRTAAVGDCDSGHTLDDDVEWPADLSIADYRISPDELVEFSMIDPLDAEPSFYNEPENYEASYIDLLIDLSSTTLVVGRLWTVSHLTYGFDWYYSQTITIDISEFDNLVTVNTGNNRVMPGVTINDEFITNNDGVTYVDGVTQISASYEDEDPLNGINVLDFILMSRHIYQLTDLSEFGMLAGDVNQDNDIKSNDLTELRKVFLDISEDITSDWRFFEKDFDNTVVIEPRGALLAIKEGDVDDSALLRGEEHPDPEAMFEIDDVLLNQGEVYTVPVYLEESYNVHGVDFRAKIDTDQITITNVTTTNSLGEPAFNVRNDGTLIIMMSDFEQSTTIGGDLTTPVFEIEFEAKENSILSLAMDFEDQFSYLGSDELSLIILGGDVGNMIGTGTNSPELNAISVYPNPTNAYLNIDITDLAVSGAFEISVFETNGRRLLTNFNTERIDVSNLESGMYYYQIKVDSYTTTGKFMVIK